MKTYNTNPKNMLDMVFENKNKNYGAYAIRNAYNDTVIKSLTIVASSLLLLVGSSLAYNNYFKEKPIEKHLETEQLLTEVLVNMEQPKAIEEPKIQQPASGAASTAISTVFNNNANEPIKPNTSLSLVTSIGDTARVLEPGLVGPGTNTVVVVATPTVDLVTPRSIVEVMPEFPGGNEALIRYLQNNMNYPQMELEAGIGGRVFVKFVVNTDGSISTAEILKGVNGGDGLSKEALRVVRAMPKWKPGKQGNNFVPVYFNLPIKFSPH